MITVISGIIMLGILVFVHEFGHFCVAKLSGVKVLKFSLGFGPKLISRQWGETEYMICAVPLGGYVQMLGEGSGEGGEEGVLATEESHRSFAGKPVSVRMAIVGAGPLMNLILPFMVLPLAYLVGVNLPAYIDRPACIGYVADGTVAARTGFLPGDCITALNGDPLPTWNDANKGLIAHVGDPMAFKVQRDGVTLDLVIEAKDGDPEGLQAMGLLPLQEARIGALSPGMPAQAAGLMVGDRVVTLGGEPVLSWYDLRPLIQKKGELPLELSIERGGNTFSVTVTPVRAEEGGDLLLGIAPLHESVFKRFGPLEALRAGTDRGLELISLTLVFLQKLFAGHISSKSIGGPITVVQIAGQAAQTDLASILTVLAFLSIQLGILNLLPIPILDGGHLFFNLFELVLRRPLSMRAREIAQQIGLVLILLLMVLAFYNDIMRLFFGVQ